MKTIPFAQVKRKDRAIEDESWIREILDRAAVGVLATVNDGQPYTNTNLFVYDQAAGAIYLHTARTGRTRTNVEDNPRVCFSVSEMGRLLPADTSLDMSVEYASVVVFGRASVVSDDAEAVRALESLLRKYFPHLEYGKDYRSIQPEELARTAVYRIQIEQWSGKRKQVAENFPGAFLYGQRQSTNHQTA
jgi:nitroimidazol reductase NimA-like FMN-containing flavoprotein (pyridoxamine 5'-phosphate oxidase superfamily)